MLEAVKRGYPVQGCIEENVVAELEKQLDNGNRMVKMKYRDSVNLGTDKRDGANAFAERKESVAVLEKYDRFSLHLQKSLLTRGCSQS